MKSLHHVISNVLICAIHSPARVTKYLRSAVFIIFPHAFLSNQTSGDFLFIDMKVLLNPSSNRPLSGRLMTAAVVWDKRAQIQAAVASYMHIIHHLHTYWKNNQTDELSWEWTVRACYSVSPTRAGRYGQKWISLYFWHICEISLGIIVFLICI